MRTQRRPIPRHLAAGAAPDRLASPAEHRAGIARGRQGSAPAQRTPAGGFPLRRLTFLGCAAALLLGCGEPGSVVPTAPDAPAFAAHECSLGISDADARTAIESMIDAVNALGASGSLNAGQAGALRTHLLNALRAIDEGRYCAARAQLQAFREQVGNFLNDGILTDPEAFGLIHSTSVVLGEPVVLPYLVTVNAPSSAVGHYDANYAEFGPSPTLAGVSGDLIVVNDGSANPTLGCNPLVGFPAGAIALVDRGTCFFTDKAKNAQDAGAVAVVIMNNVVGGEAIALGRPTLQPTITIPTVSLSFADGVTLKSGLPATGTVSRKPQRQV